MPRHFMKLRESAMHIPHSERSSGRTGSEATDPAQLGNISKAMRLMTSVKHLRPGCTKETKKLQELKVTLASTP